MTPLVSVILPTYNRATTLARAVNSVLDQTFTDLELIIIDDGSTDDTPAVLRQFSRDGHVRIIPSSHRGCAAARNLGVSQARGSYLAFQDSDDEWLPHKLARAMASLENTGPDTGVFYSDMIRIFPDGSVADMTASEVVPGRLINEATLDYQPLGIGIQSTVIKRHCFETVGGFDEALPRFIDLELFIRLSARFRFVHCRETLAKYYFGQGISTDRSALVAARRHLIRKYRRQLTKPRRHLAQQYLHLAVALQNNGEKLASLQCEFKALLTSPWHRRIRQDALALLTRRGQSLAARLRRPSVISR
jgi:glycosyltransferase involved in cell wall biosynthesis